MIALRSALDYLLEVPRGLAEPAVVCTDSRSALAALREGPAARRSLQEAEVCARVLAITAEGHSIFMQWLPSHCGIA